MRSAARGSPGRLPGVARADPAEHGALGPAGGRRRRGADRHDAVSPLRRPRSRDRPEPELGGVRIPGADLRAARGREAAEDPRARGLRGDARGRRLRRRLGLRRRCGRGGLAERGLDVVVLEAAGYFNESDFAQLELPAYQEMFWRGGPTRPPTATSAWSRGPRSAAAPRSTGPTACAPAPGSASSGREHGLEGVDGAGLRPPPRRGPGADQRERPLQRPERDPAAAARGRPRRSAGASRRSSATPTASATRPRWRGISASATSPGASRAPTAPGSPTRRSTGRRFLTLHPRDAGAGRGRPGRGRRGGLARPRTAAARRSPSGAARGRRLRLARVAGAAAALGHRRAAVGHNLRLHPSSVVGGVYGDGPAGLVGRAAGRPLRRVRRHRRGLRLPDRDAQYAPG